MANEHQTALRLPVELLGRADALAEKLRNDPALAAIGQITRSAVLRLAIIRGLDALEREQAVPTTKRGR